MVQIIRMCQAIFIVLLMLTVSSNGASIRKRSADKAEKAEKDDKVVTICQDSHPCGWGVYQPFTRQIDYFMKNTCECSSELQCIRTDDDLSVSAYVYRCREKKINDTPLKS